MKIKNIFNFSIKFAFAKFVMKLSLAIMIFILKSLTANETFNREDTRSCQINFASL